MDDPRIEPWWYGAPTDQEAVGPRSPGSTTTIASFFQRATVEIWNHIPEPKKWLTISAQFVNLQNKLEAEPSKGQPYNVEAANGLRKLFRDEAKLLKTLVDFEKTLARVRVEASQHNKSYLAEANAQAEAKQYADTQARVRARAAARAREETLSAEREKQEEEDRKLVEQFVVVDEREIEEPWEEVEQPQEDS